MEKVKQTSAALSTKYTVAIVMLTIMIAATFVLIVIYMSAQRQDSRVINLSGRQRMLSQRITQISLHIREDRSKGLMDDNLYVALESAVYDFKNSHTGLRYGDDTLGLNDNNSQTILDFFNEIDPYFNEIFESASFIVDNPDASYNELNSNVENIIENEEPFLVIMDKIVFQYDAESKLRVTKSITITVIAFSLLIFVLLAEISFIFWPTAKQTIKLMRQMDDLNEKLTQNLTKVELDEENLVKANKELDQKNNELARMNKLMIGRELKMVEMKKQMKDKT